MQGRSIQFQIITSVESKISHPSFIHTSGPKFTQEKMIYHSFLH